MQKYEYFSTFYHFLTNFSTILSTKFINLPNLIFEDMKAHIRLILSAFCIFSVSCGPAAENEAESTSVPVAEEGIHLHGSIPDSLEIVKGKVRNGQFFSTLLGSLGMSAAEAYNLTEACDSVFDPRDLRVGNGYEAYYSVSDSTGRCLEYLVYERDRESRIEFRCRPPYSAKVCMKEVTVESRYADVTITSSLWNAMVDAGASPLLIASISDIYAWTIDFFAVQKGDRFKVLYEQKVCEGEVIAIDTVRYAEFSHGGSVLPMIMYNQKDGGNIWWNEKGESMRKAFLKAPLQYSRVSSGFSYARRHPVTRRVQPHTGVDYAAPKGTPVMTIGDGTVISVKYEGAGGNTVRIRHNSVYTTAYLHLSRYAKGLKAGQRVRQGEVIGYVGSTGRSTGPHLDFRVWKNGSPINPLKMDSPPAEPLKKENMASFEAAAQNYKVRIDTIQAQSMVLELLRNF